MSKIKLLLDVVENMRSLSDSIEIIAKAMGDGDVQRKVPELKEFVKTLPTPKVTHEMARELAVNLSKNGKREEVKELITQFGVKNITSFDETNLEEFYKRLKELEVSNNAT